jgi:uncharacterized membrane protein
MIDNINVINLKLLTIIHAILDFFFNDVLNVNKVIIKNVRMETCK